jgi:para-aminobenzoate synthetase / 4-amino-4-deoxychorismate lyase
MSGTNASAIERSHLNDEFRLIETMGVSEHGEVQLLDRHLERLNRSARFFSFKCHVAKLRDDILRAVPRDGRPACLRLTLANNGESTLESGALPTGYAQRLRLSSVRVHSDDVFLYHKTTHRGIYEQARKDCDEQTDAILINERGEITETTIMNIAVFRDGRWITPQTSCGLLPGVMREELLGRGEMVEGVVHASELRPGELIRCFNALRGVFDVMFKESGIKPQTAQKGHKKAHRRL